MNHPEKVYVAGSGMKNRYRTIIPSTLPYIVILQLLLVKHVYKMHFILWIFLKVWLVLLKP